MFSGIVAHTGRIDEVIEIGKTKRFLIDCDALKDELKLGDSIAVNGVCQTVEQINVALFQIFSIPETLVATNLAFLEKGSIVNLELPLAVGDRFHGHIVQGHVEKTAPISKVEKHEDYLDITIELSSPYLVEKGSVSLDGISLTIQHLSKNTFSVQIIPETIKRTNILEWHEGYQVNIETDYLLHAIDSLLKNRGK